MSKIEQYLTGTLEEIDVSQFEFLRQHAFSYQKSLLSVNLGHITVVPKNCFDYCSKLNHVDMPNVERIETTAFGHCYALKELDLSKVKYVIADPFFYAYIEVFDFASAVEMSLPLRCATHCKKAWIPSTCTITNALTDVDSYGQDRPIYTDATERPDCWPENWNPEGWTVHWGSTHEEFEAA